LRTTWNRSVPVPVPGMKPLNDRWRQALGHLLATRGELFAGTDLDPQAIVQRMEKLVGRVEALLADRPKEQEAAALSPTERLAAQLRQAFASNAMGSRPGDAKQQRASSDAVREAQHSWQRLPPIDLPEAKALDVRFREACRQLDGGRRGGHQHRHRPAPRPADEVREPEPATV